MILIVALDLRKDRDFKIRLYRCQPAKNKAYTLRPSTHARMDAVVKDLKGVPELRVPVLFSTMYH